MLFTCSINILKNTLPQVGKKGQGLLKTKCNTYIIGHYNPSSQDYWPSFLHHICCVLFLYISGGTYSLESTLNDRYFEKLFMAIFIYSQRIFARNLLRGNRRRNTFRISFWNTLRKSPKKYFSYFVVMFGLGLEPWLFV